MFNWLRKLHYAARVVLSGGGGPQTVNVAGRSTVVMQGGKGSALVYLHSPAAESLCWLPFHENLASSFELFAPVHPGFGQSGGFDQMRSVEDMAFHYVELFDQLGLGEVVR